MKKLFAHIALSLAAGTFVLFFSCKTSHHNYQIVSVGESIVLFEPETGDIYYTDNMQWFKRGIDGKSVEIKELPK